jgi:2-oxoisovalerate dehydrogenase E1 component alpha subunit
LAGFKGLAPVAVYTAVKAAREKAIAGGGPTLIEAKCYRFLSHTTDDDDRTYRTRDEVEQQRSQDPIPRFERYLRERGIVTEQEVETMRQEIGRYVNELTDRIEAEPLPEPASLYTNVYAGPTDPWV